MNGQDFINLSANVQIAFGVVTLMVLVVYALFFRGSNSSKKKVVKH